MFVSLFHHVTAGLNVPKNMYSALLTGISKIADNLNDTVFTTSNTKIQKNYLFLTYLKIYINNCIR